MHLEATYRRVIAFGKLIASSVVNFTLVHIGTNLNKKCTQLSFLEVLSHASHEVYLFLSSAISSKKLSTCFVLAACTTPIPNGTGPV
jgi:hypothetical protein